MEPTSVKMKHGEQNLPNSSRALSSVPGFQKHMLMNYLDNLTGLKKLPDRQSFKSNAYVAFKSFKSNSGV